MDKNDVDESLIEATIRRVAEAQAARAAGGETGTETDAPEPEEAPIADSNAGPPAGTQVPDVAEGEAPEPASETAHVVADDPAAVAAQPEAAAVDESAIEATIRRVQAAKAAREHKSAAVEPTRDEPAPADPISFPTRGNVLPRAAQEPDSLTSALERIERTLTDIDQTVRLLAAQLNRHPAPAIRSFEPVPPAEDSWDEETPAVMSPGFGAPPRPAIFRDVVPVEDQPAHPAPPQPQAAAPAFEADDRRGFDLLPRTYRITVEDKRRAVDLVPLHRALLGLDGVRDMSLLSYNNGVALVSLETVSDIDIDALGRAVTRAMSREARVETHNERTLVIKLAED